MYEQKQYAPLTKAEEDAVIARAVRGEMPDTLTHWRRCTRGTAG